MLRAGESPVAALPADAGEFPAQEDDLSCEAVAGGCGLYGVTREALHADRGLPAAEAKPCPHWYRLQRPGRKRCGGYTWRHGLLH